MCDTLRNTRRRGRSAVPLMRFRCLSAIRCRRSLVVLIFINQVPASSYQPPASSFQLEAGRWRLFRSGLPGLLLQHFTRIADALLLVGVRLAERADVGRHLPHELPVYAGHGEVRLLVDRHVDPAGDVEHHGMRVAEREVHLLAFHFGAVPDADDVEVLAEALRHAADGICDEAAREAVELAELGICTKGPCLQLIAVDLEPDACRQRLPELAFRPLDFDGARLDVDFHALRNRDDFFTNARHKSASSFLLSAASINQLPASTFQLAAGGWRLAASTTHYRALLHPHRPSPPRGRS